MGKISKDYKYQLSQNYDYTDSQIEITNGHAQLVQNSTTSKYGTNDPYITTYESLIATAINSFTETSSNGTGDIIKYITVVNNEDKYWTGTGEVWGASNGSYSQANTADEIQTHGSSIISARSRIKFKAFLHSETGDTTPQLQNLNISYDFSGYCLPDDVRSLLVGLTIDDLKDETIAAYIESADEIINFYIGMQYGLPITDSNAIALLRTWSMILSSYNIYTYLTNREGSNLATLATRRYEKLIETLEKISTGEQSLTGLINSNRVDCSTIDYSPIFDLGSVYAWQVDPDLLDTIAEGDWYG